MTTYEQAVLDLAGPVPASFDTFHAGPNQALAAILQACAEGDFRLGDFRPDEPQLAELRPDTTHSGEAHGQAADFASTRPPPPSDVPSSDVTAPWVYLTGAPGSGRSHLLLASCQRARSCGRDALYLGLKQPPAHIPPSLTDMENVALVALDDIDAVAGKPDWEEGLFHFLNRARASGAWILMSAEKGPQEAGFLLPDLRSRLSWGQRHKLKSLDDEGLSSVLKIHAEARGLPLDDKLIRYLLNHCERNCGSLLSALGQLQQAAFASKRKPSLNLAASLFSPAREPRDEAEQDTQSAPAQQAAEAAQTATQETTTETWPSTAHNSELPNAPWADPEYIPPDTPRESAAKHDIPSSSPPWETPHSSDSVPVWEQELNPEPDTAEKKKDA